MARSSFSHSSRLARSDASSFIVNTSFFASSAAKRATSESASPNVATVAFEFRASVSASASNSTAPEARSRWFLEVSKIRDTRSRMYGKDRNCSAVKRRAGSLTSKARTTSSYSPANSPSSAGGSVSTMFLRSVSLSPPSNGGAPAASWYMTHPNPHMSPAVEHAHPSPEHTSGGAYNGVPPARARPSSSLRARALPKSPSLTIPSSSTSTFSGFTSPCTIPHLSCTCRSAIPICAA
mmetsp:Transcript_8203/g.32763  ORF Transcript_8203/g.32763 Transcript_8203/m.32763 type:complete len:237 (+) Transcript_8203:795-1505(+)